MLSLGLRENVPEALLVSFQRGRFVGPVHLVQHVFKRRLGGRMLPDGVRLGRMCRLGI